jgi:phosphoribosylaminoimidazole (AIR) synthetase
MILVVPPAQVAHVESELKRRREKFFMIGRIEASGNRKSRVVYSGTLES